MLISLQRDRHGRWDPAGPGDSLDYTEGALSLAVVHVQVCWTFLWVEFLLCSPCCLPSPPRAHGLLFLASSPEQALASRCSGLFVAVAAVTLTSSGIQKFFLNKLLSLDTVPALHVPRNIFGGKLLHDSPWCWWSHKAFLSFPSHSLLFTSPCGCL